jgi:hypothetical protein
VGRVQQSSRTPPQCAAQGLLPVPPLGSRPSLHHLRRRRSYTRSLVRQLHRYYAAIRLPAPMTRGRVPTGFTTRTALAPLIDRCSRSRTDGISRFPTSCFRACMRPQTAQGPHTPRDVGVSDVAFGMTSLPRHPKPVISRLNTCCWRTSHSPIDDTSRVAAQARSRPAELHACRARDQAKDAASCGRSPLSDWRPGAMRCSTRSRAGDASAVAGASTRAASSAR